MNKRTAKLLRKAAVATGRKYRGLKRQWNLLPWNERHNIRRFLELKVAAFEQEREGR